MEKLYLVQTFAHQQVNQGSAVKLDASYYRIHKKIFIQIG